MQPNSYLSPPDVNKKKSINQSTSNPYQSYFHLPKQYQTFINSSQQQKLLLSHLLWWENTSMPILKLVSYTKTNENNCQSCYPVLYSVQLQPTIKYGNIVKFINIGQAMYMIKQCLLGSQTLSFKFNRSLALIKPLYIINIKGQIKVWYNETHLQFPQKLPKLPFHNPSQQGPFPNIKQLVQHIFAYVQNYIKLSQRQIFYQIKYKLFNQQQITFSQIHHHIKILCQHFNILVPNSVNLLNCFDPIQQHKKIKKNYIRNSEYSQNNYFNFKNTITPYFLRNSQTTNIKRSITPHAFKIHHLDSDISQKLFQKNSQKFIPSKKTHFLKHATSIQKPQKPCSNKKSKKPSKSSKPQQSPDFSHQQRSKKPPMFLNKKSKLLLLPAKQRHLSSHSLPRPSYNQHLPNPQTISFISNQHLSKPQQNFLPKFPNTPYQTHSTQNPTIPKFQTYQNSINDSLLQIKPLAQSQLKTSKKPTQQQSKITSISQSTALDISKACLKSLATTTTYLSINSHIQSHTFTCKDSIQDNTNLARSKLKLFQMIQKNKAINSIMVDIPFNNQIQQQPQRTYDFGGLLPISKPSHDKINQLQTKQVQSLSVSKKNITQQNNKYQLDNQLGFNINQITKFLSDDINDLKQSIVYGQIKQEKYQCIQLQKLGKFGKQIYNSYIPNQ